MLRENANNVAFDSRSFIEQVGGYSLYNVAMSHKLRLPRDAWRTLCLREIIHRGVADLALHGFTVVHHRKCERQSLVVVSHNLATRQRHRNPFLGNETTALKDLAKGSHDQASCATSTASPRTKPPSSRSFA